MRTRAYERPRLRHTRLSKNSTRPSRELALSLSVGRISNPSGRFEKPSYPSFESRRNTRLAESVSDSKKSRDASSTDTCLYVHEFDRHSHSDGSCLGNPLDLGLMDARQGVGNNPSDADFGGNKEFAPSSWEKRKMSYPTPPRLDSGSVDKV